MRPLIAVTIVEGLAVDAGWLVEQLNWYADREYGEGRVNLRALLNEEDLRSYMAGQMVLYRKPARKHGDKYIYEKDGERHELEQMKVFDT